MTFIQHPETEALSVVIEARGAWDLSGTVFTGDVKVEDPETGKTKWITGEHGEHDYDWDGHWNP
jgi:hypothetical protein